MIGIGFLVRVGEFILAILALAFICIIVYGTVLGTAVVLQEILGIQTKAFTDWLRLKLPKHKKRKNNAQKKYN